jgi:hypothetical protein
MAMEAPYKPTPVVHDQEVEQAVRANAKIEVFMHQFGKVTASRKSRETGPPGWDAEF